MDVKTLERIGLTKGEIRAYLALLRLGPAAAGMVAKESRVSRSKVYLVLDRLEKKGMASHIKKGGVAHFIAVEPSKIMDYIRERQGELEGLKREFEGFLPELEARYRSQGNVQNITVYQGYKGLRVSHEHMYLKLKRGDEYYVIGAPGGTIWSTLDSFWIADHRRRIREGIRCKILFNADVERHKLMHRNSLHECEARYMPIGMVTPAEIEVFADTTILITFSTEPISIEIVSQEIADSFKAYFRQFWDRAKPEKKAQAALRRAR